MRRGCFSAVGFCARPGRGHRKSAAELGEKQTLVEVDVGNEDVLRAKTSGFWEGGTPCWDVRGCPAAVRQECPAPRYTAYPCWEIEGTCRDGALPPGGLRRARCPRALPSGVHGPPEGEGRGCLGSRDPWLAHVCWASRNCWLAPFQVGFSLPWLAPICWASRTSWLARGPWFFQSSWLAHRSWGSHNPRNTRVLLAFDSRFLR